MQEDPQLLELHSLTQLVQILTNTLDTFSATTDSQLDDLKNQISQTNLRLKDLKDGLPDPPPIIEDWSDNPKPTPPIPRADPTPMPPQAENSSELVKQIAFLVEEHKKLPARLERGLLSSLLSLINFRQWVYLGLAAISAHAVLTAALIIATLHFLPPPLNSRNEAQLYQIYKQIR